MRGWDVASSKKERTKDDPDATCGTKACYHDGWIYVDDVVIGEWSTLKRDAIMKSCGEADGIAIPAYIEVVAGYKDVYNYVRNLLAPQGIVVRKFIPSGKGDKVTRAGTTLEAIFELGHVKIKRADWNDAWLQELGSFPSVPHDDQVDSLVTAIYRQVHSDGGGGQVHIR